jgi:hypothetical protein
MTKKNVVKSERRITGKCISKKTKGMYIFEGADPVPYKGGWKITANKVHEVMSKAVYDKMKRGDLLY